MPQARGALRVDASLSWLRAGSGGWPGLFPGKVLAAEGGHGFIAELERDGWTAAAMPAGAYGADDQAVPTVVMTTSLGFHADASGTAG